MNERRLVSEIACDRGRLATRKIDSAKFHPRWLSKYGTEV